MGRGSIRILRQGYVRLGQQREVDLVADSVVGIDDNAAARLLQIAGGDDTCEKPIQFQEELRLRSFSCLLQLLLFSNLLF